MDLFKGKKVLYVHGFASSGQSGTVTRIREVLTQATVIMYAQPKSPTLSSAPRWVACMLRCCEDTTVFL